MAITTDLIPKVGISTSGVLTFLFWFIVFVLIAGLTAFITYRVIQKKRYKYKIRVYKTINGRPYEAFNTVACDRYIKNSSESAFLCQKPKKLLPTPQIQSGANLFLYYIKDDGHWVNFGLEDLNNKARLMGVHFTDADMRYQKESMLDNFKQEFSNESWLTKNAGWLMYTGLIVLTGIMTYINFKQFHDTAGALTSAMDVSTKVLDKLDHILANLDNVCTGGGAVATVVAG